MTEHKFINEIEHKYCGTCDKWLILDKFYNNKDTYDKKRSNCIDCVNSWKKKCEFKECNTYAVHNFKFCKKHGGGRKCIECDTPARGKSKYCVKHNPSICKFKNCTRKPCDDTSYCTTHNETYRCKFEGCENIKIANRNGYCRKHGEKLYCIVENCDRIQHRGKKCEEHFFNGKRPKCVHGKKPAYCVDCGGNQICIHKKERSSCVECGGGSICIHKIPKTRCIDCGGGNICIHKKRRNRCYICDQPKHPQNWCESCKIMSILHSNYKPYCLMCYCMKNPEAKIVKKYKLKEHYLRETLQENYKNISMIFDKKIDNGCSLRRPDVRIECITHTIIIECDENRHQGYSCENKRIMEIFQDLGNRPIVFLRFNPDSYKDIATGKSISGCFRKTKKINNSLQKNEWDRRINILNERITHYLNNLPEKEVITEHLFY